jgi:hypothetical protein
MRWLTRLRRRVRGRLRGSVRLRLVVERLRRVPPRRAAAAVGVLGLAVVAVVWAVRNGPAIAAAAPAIGAGAVVLIAVVQALLWRTCGRMLAEVGALTARGTGAVDRVEATQRRILAALESERLAAADRQRLLVAGMSELRSDTRDALDRAYEDQQRELARLVPEPAPRVVRPSVDASARGGLPLARTVDADGS